MSLKYKKIYLVPFRREKDEDYWLKMIWVGNHMCESCMMIPERLPGHRVRGNENFFLLSMNKKRDAMDCYKMYGRDLMIDYLDW